MMILKCLFVASVAMVGLSPIHSAKSDELTPKKLAENFKKINAHLDKRVQSDDTESLVKEVENMLNKKSSKLIQFGGNKSLVKTLEYLNDLSRATLDSELCRNFVKSGTLRKLDAGLESYPRDCSINWVPTKVDKLIKSLAFKLVRLCDWNREFSHLQIVHNEATFDEINKNLINEFRDRTNREDDIAETKRFIDDLEPQNGVAVEVGREILKLDSVLNKDSCNEKGHEILLKNSLAMRNKVTNMYNYPKQNIKNLRRLEKHLVYYIEKHEEVCRPIARESFKSAIKTLDQDTYRKVLALVSSYYLDRSVYPQVIESIIKKEVDEDFTIPLMNERAQEMLSKSAYFAEVWNIRHLRIVLDQRLIIRAFLKALSPNGKDRKIEDVAERDSVLSQYLFEPCEKYLKVMGPVVEVHSIGMPVNYPKTAANELAKDMTYNMVYSGYRTCMFILSHREFIFEEIERTPL